MSENSFMGLVVFHVTTVCIAARRSAHLNRWGVTECLAWLIVAVRLIGVESAVRVPLLCSWANGKSPPDAARPRRAASDERPPRDPGHCRAGRNRPGSIGRRSCPDGRKRFDL